MTEQDRLDCIEFTRLIGENSAKLIPLLEKYGNFGPPIGRAGGEERVRIELERFITYFDVQCKRIPD